MTCVMSRNAKFRKNRRGKWKNPAIPKVLGFSDPMIPSYVFYLCPRVPPLSSEPRQRCSCHRKPPGASPGTEG